MAASENFRTNLRRAIESHGTSQRALATAAGVSFTHLNRILQGHNDPTIEICERLARAAGVPMISLFLDPADFFVPAA